MASRSSVLAAASLVLSLVACHGLRSPGEPAAPHLPFADDLDLPSLAQALERCRACPAAATAGQAAERLLRILERIPAGLGRHEALLAAFRARALPDPVLLTAYYEPELRVRSRPDAVFRWPIHALPADPAERARTRREIYDGALDGRGLELAWTDDPFALFLAHVQGSARMHHEDGRILALRYAGTNGQPYRALGAVLVARGHLPREEATLPGIRRALSAYPEQELLALLAENPRYTFFAPGEGPDPVGSFGIPLTAGRSVAADPALLPPGSLLWLDMPSVQRFVVVQDTGVAITGHRLDLFAGAGSTAETFAGTLRDRGVVYVLEPR